MNEMNDFEMQLRSLAPRRPSAKLRSRIFATNRKAGLAQQSDAPGACCVLRIPFSGVVDAVSAMAHRLKPKSFRWLAPAMAGLFLTCILLNQRNAPMASPATAPLIAMILSSNQSAAAYLPGSFQREQNRLPSDTFEWTNAGSSTSSIRSLFLQSGK